MIAGRYRLEKEIGRGGAGVRPPRARRAAGSPGGGQAHRAAARDHGRTTCRAPSARLGWRRGSTTRTSCRSSTSSRTRTATGSSWSTSRDARSPSWSPTRGAPPTGVRRPSWPRRRTASSRPGRREWSTATSSPATSSWGATTGPKLGDFGIARASSDTVLTQTGLITGSPAYLAPEVASGAPATEASDVWSLGGTLYHALVGSAAVRRRGEPAGRAVQDRPRRSAPPARRPPRGRAARRDAGQGPRPALAGRAGARRPAQDRPGRAVAGSPRRDGRDGQTTTVMATQPMAPARAATDRHRRRTPDGRPRRRPRSPPPARAATRPLRRARAPGAPARGWWSRPLLALVLVAGLATWLLWLRRRQEPDAGGTTEPSDGLDQSRSPSQDPTSESPPESPSREPGRAHAVGRSRRDAGRHARVRPGLLLPRHHRPGGDLRAAHPGVPVRERRLRAATRASGARSSSATPRAIQPDPRSLTTTYTIDFVDRVRPDADRAGPAAARAAG